MDRWDVAIILAAGYIAIMTLIRLMARRRNQALKQIHEQLGQRPAAPQDAADSPAEQQDRGAA